MTAEHTRPAVVVTALEASTSLGTTVESTWDALLAGKTGIHRLTQPWVEEFDLACKVGGVLLEDPADSLKKVEARRLDFIEQVSLVVARRLWEKAGSPEVDTYRLGVSVGTGIGGAASLLTANNALYQGGPRKVSPHSVPMLMPNGSAAGIGLEFHAKAGVHTPTSACSSGNEAIADAYRMIVRGDADIVIAGGAEARISELSVAAFTQLRAMSTRNDDPEAASRPFDKDRDGFVFGEACALLLLETEEHAKARGATILARVLGAGSTSDGYHIVAPEPNGEGAARAITRALEDAGLSPRDIQHVNAHATSTGVGDLAESRAINAALGDHTAVYAPKGALGHSIGAVGALEGALTVLAVQNGIIPPTLNLDNQDPEINLDVVHGQPRELQIEAAVNNSFGFGGHNIAVVFGRA